MRVISFFKRYLKYRLSFGYKRDVHTWVFGEWFGQRVGDNSTYLANYLADNYNNIKVYWLCHNACDTRMLSPNINIVDYNSPNAVNISKKASVAIMNEGIRDLNESIVNYWGNAIKVNLWHGIAWKKIGYDALKSKKKTIFEHMREQMYSYDYFVSPSDEYASKIRTAFHARENAFINAGYPRNSLFFDKNKCAECRKKIESKINCSEAKIIVYLPTFRDSQTQTFSFTNIDNPSFTKWLVSNNVYIIQKAHFADENATNQQNDRVLIINDVSAQELMAASDMLITDYSSCFFDYLLLDRPIIHYIYDYEFYKNQDRGLYYDKQDVTCGPFPETESDLIKEIIRNIQQPELFHELRMHRKEKFLTYENPNSCKTIIESLIKELELKE